MNIEEIKKTEISHLNLLEFSARFLLLTEQIFGKIDNKHLTDCREVIKSWKSCTDKKNFSCLRIVNIPRVLQNGNTYLHTVARTGHLKMLEWIIENKNILDPKNDVGKTPFHFTCINGHVNGHANLKGKQAQN